MNLEGSCSHSVLNREWQLANMQQTIAGSHAATEWAVMPVHRQQELSTRYFIPSSWKKPGLRLNDGKLQLKCSLRKLQARRWYKSSILLDTVSSCGCLSAACDSSGLHNTTSNNRESIVLFNHTATTATKWMSSTTLSLTEPGTACAAMNNSTQGIHIQATSAGRDTGL